MPGKKVWLMPAPGCLGTKQEDANLQPSITVTVKLHISCKRLTTECSAKLERLQNIYLDIPRSLPRCLLRL